MAESAVADAPTRSSRPAQIRLTSDLEIPVSTPIPPTRSSTRSRRDSVDAGLDDHRVQRLVDQLLQRPLGEFTDQVGAVTDAEHIEQFGQAESDRAIGVISSMSTRTYTSSITPMAHLIVDRSAHRPHYPKGLVRLSRSCQLLASYPVATTGGRGAV